MSQQISEPTLGEIKEFIKGHKKRCPKCNEIVERLDGVYKCICGHSWASLFIQRIPPEIYEKFREMADNEFVGDYGMLLKFLVDSNYDEKLAGVVGILGEHEQRISSLENHPAKPITTIGGKQIRR